MKIKLEDKSLVDDYVLALTNVEKILWKGAMGKPPKYLENYNPGCLPETLLYVLFLVISYTISSGGVCFTLFFLSVPSCMFLIHYYRQAKEIKLEFAQEQTQYLITNKRIIFILYHNKTIHIQSISYENIEKVYSNKRLEEAANIYISTNKPVNFQTFKFWSQKPHDKIVLVQVEDYQEALDLIQEHLF